MREPECMNRIEGNRRAVCMNPTRRCFKRKVSPKTCLICPKEYRLRKVLAEALRASVEGVSGPPSDSPQEAHMGDVAIGPLGTLIYQRDGWEPPPCPPGYVRESLDPTSDFAWVLHPEKDPCEHLEILPAEKGSCGYRRVKRRCRDIDSFIGPATCSTCTKRDD